MPNSNEKSIARRGQPAVTRLLLGLAISVSTFTPGSLALQWPAVPAAWRNKIVESTITDVQRALQNGEVTSRQLVEIYLERIEKYRTLLNPVITINPNARAAADRLDKERAAGRVRGPLHGIPIALKDNIHTTDMRTTGGAIVIAKTVMTELANWVTGGMPANYSAVGGYGFNPYDPRTDPRSDTNDGRPALPTGGSSSGIGTAASLWMANVGTETSGSILSPSNANMLVGIKPTVGRISRYGIIPITADQDTAGPMARTVADAAILLGVMEGVDPRDPATSTCTPEPGHDYTKRLNRSGLKGARIGIPHVFYWEPTTAPGASAASGGLNASQRLALEEAVDIMKREGATIVDPADIPSATDPKAANNALVWTMCNTAKAADSNCSTSFKYGFFNAWLASLGPSAPVKGLTELREFNLANKARNAIKYGQTLLDNSDEMDLVADKARYEADRARDVYINGTHGIDEAIETHKLDALIFGSNIGAALAARPGYPTVIVPFGMIPNAPTPPFPGGFDAKPSPFGVSFTGRKCGEGRLLELAYAFEQATKRRVPPASAP